MLHNKVRKNSMKDNKVGTNIHMRYVNSLADTYKEIPEFTYFLWWTDPPDLAASGLNKELKEKHHLKVVGGDQTSQKWRRGTENKDAMEKVQGWRKQQCDFVKGGGVCTEHALRGKYCGAAKTKSNWKWFLLLYHREIKDKSCYI